MSLLSIAISEIQKPSWWGEQPSCEQPEQGRAVKVAGTNAIKRQELIKSIKARGGEMTVSDLIDETGWTKQTIGALVAPLVKDGMLIRDSSYTKTTYRIAPATV